jgi:putative ABC transport system substrate-binding protein
MTSRRQTLVLLALTLPGALRAQSKTARIGLLWLGAPDNASQREAFLARMREHGYAEGTNLVIDDRTRARRYEDLLVAAKDLAGSNVDLIVTFGATSVRAAAHATKTIPVVMNAGVDPVKAGLAASLARPGGNVTGVTTLTEELQDKQVQLLRDALPRAKRVGALVNPTSDAGTGYLRLLQDKATRAGLQLQPLEVRGADDLEKAFGHAVGAKVDAVIVVAASLFTTMRSRIAELALQNRLPCFGYSPEFAEAGAMLAYGFDRQRAFRRTADYVARILGGARPAELPIERSADFELVVNLKTARAIGVAVPAPVLLRATRTIE